MNSKQKISLSLVIFGVLVAAIISFLIYPFFTDIKKSSETFLAQKKNIILLEKEKESLKKMGNIYKTYQSDLSNIEKLFISAEFPVEFINFLERNASSSSVALTIVSLAKSAENENDWPSLALQLSLSSSPSSFLQFLEKLENSPYLVEITDFNIRKTASEKELKTGESSLAKINASLSIKVFAK